MRTLLLTGGCSLLVLVDDPGVPLAGGQVHILDEQGDLVVLIQAGPQLVGQGLGVGGGDGHLPGLALKGGEGIQILLIGVDEAALAGLGVVIAEEIAAAAGGVAVVALQDGQGVAAVLVDRRR